MAWIYLLIAGLFEIAWAIGLKYTEGFSRLWPSAGTAVMGMILFDESRDLVRILCILAIVAAIAGLRFSAPA